MQIANNSTEKCQSIQRRKFLITASFAGSSVISGCLSSSKQKSQENNSSNSNQKGIGQQKTLDDGSKLTIEDVVITNEIANSESITKVADEKRFVLIELSVTSGEENYRSPSSDVFSIEANEITYDPMEDVETIIQPVNGDLYSSDISESSTEWLVFEIPQDIATAKFKFYAEQNTWSIRPNNDNIVIFERSLTAPNSVEIGGALEYSFNIENTGGRTGRFYQSLSLGDSIDRTIDGGEQITVTRSYAIKRYNDGILNIKGQQGSLTQVNIEPVSASFGNKAVGPHGLELMISEPVIAQEVSYDYGVAIGTEEAGAGLQFVLTDAEVVNPTVDWKDSPVGTGTLSADGEEYEAEGGVGPQPSNFTEPISGPEPYNANEVNITDGESEDWVEFWKTPDDVAKEDISVQFSYDIAIDDIHDKILFEFS
jgi:hypothetical protein